jgi:hypothetical protein
LALEHGTTLRIGSPIMANEIETQNDPLTVHDGQKLKMMRDERGKDKKE